MNAHEDNHNHHFLVVLAVTLVAGCSDRSAVSQSQWAYDQCLRREVFMQCLAAVPKGPERTATSNDWDEVVGQCGDQARAMSAFPLATVKPECALPL